MGKDRNNRTKILNLRLTEAEYNLLQQRFGKTVQRKFSDYARALLLAEPVVMGYRDLVMDDMMTELSALRKDLNGIANNVNQAVHKLHIMDDNHYLSQWVLHFEQLHTTSLQQITSIKSQLNKIAEVWLQK